MLFLGILIIFPLLVALLMLGVKSSAVRSVLVKLSAVIIAGTSIALLISTFGKSGSGVYTVPYEWINYLMLAVETVIAGYLVWGGIKHKKYGVVALVAVQTVLTIGFELFFGERIPADGQLRVDNLSLILALLVGIVGCLICIFAVGYMAKYHHHKKVEDRSPIFFSVVFAFISAMFGLAFSNNLMWLLFFWEITTVCSFLLIGYTRKEEAISNSYRALFMNLFGGLAFLIGNIYLYLTQGVINLDAMLSLNSAAVLLPAVLISFSGIVKSAQMPFSSWLTGAMVAPTPTSALLHSSTMVKAGVYVIIRMSPILRNTTPGIIISFIGAATFLFASCIAISQHNVKRLLAYSTISVLGLIVTCAGVGTYQAVWTAILLMIFHAVAKSLLFLSVGTVEQGIESLNIENMDGLILWLPRVTCFLIVGICGMFLAPFGMLISKWAALEALVQVNPLIAIFVVFGSAATLFFYTKWMGKLIMIVLPAKADESFISSDEWFTMTALSLLTVLVCGIFPLISNHLIDPFIQSVYGHLATMGKGNVIIMLIMLGLIMVLPLQIVLQNKNRKFVKTYLCGANITEGSVSYQANTQYHTAGRAVETTQLKNYYFESYFGEERLGKVGTISGVLLLMILFGVCFL